MNAAQRNWIAMTNSFEDQERDVTSAESRKRARLDQCTTNCSSSCSTNGSRIMSRCSGELVLLSPAPQPKRRYHAAAAADGTLCHTTDGNEFQRQLLLLVVQSHHASVPVKFTVEMQQQLDRHRSSTAPQWGTPCQTFTAPAHQQKLSQHLHQSSHSLSRTSTTSSLTASGSGSAYDFTGAANLSDSATGASSPSSRSCHPSFQELRHAWHMEACNVSSKPLDNTPQTPLGGTLVERRLSTTSWAGRHTQDNPMMDRNRAPRPSMVVNVVSDAAMPLPAAPRSPQLRLPVSVERIACGITGVHSSADEVEPTTCTVGWYAKCRGCGQLTGGEMAVAGCSEIPFCAECSHLLHGLPQPQKRGFEKRLLAIHAGWMKSGF